MTIKYKAIPRINPSDRTAEKKYYASIVSDGRTDLNELADYASDTSTVSKADILAVMEATFQKIAKDLAAGRSISVGEYFSLRLACNSEPSDTEDKVTTKNIIRIKTVFRPGTLIQDELATAKYEKYKPNVPETETDTEPAETPET